MLRLGWPTIALICLSALVLAGVYLVVTPKQYESSTVLFVAANSPPTIDDLQSGADYSSTAVVTYAAIIDSPTVLGPAATELRPQLDVDRLRASVNTAVPEETTLIDVVASATNPSEAAAIANATADSAVQVLPGLQAAPNRAPLVSVQQLGRAVEPESPVSPDAARTLAIALVVGLGLGLATTITRQSLDTRIRRAEDLRGLTQTPLMATLPQLGRSPGRVLARLGGAARGGLIVRDQPSSSAGEAFRTLRTNLRFLEATNTRSLVFAAVADDHDGAQVPANLAWTLAQSGRRVLLIDLDLRQSTVGDAFGMTSGPGIGDVLTHAASLEEAVRETRNPYLRVLPSGKALLNPSDLLSAPMMVNTLRRLEAENDFVVIHVPPVLSYADAAVASTIASATLVSVGFGHTRAPDLTAALNILGNVGVTPLGLVVTGAERTTTRTAGKALGVHRPAPPLDAPTQQHYPVKPMPRPRTSTSIRRRSSTAPASRHDKD